MNDRFRFRVWNKEEKYMIYNAETAYDGNNYMFPEYQIEPKANNDGHIHCFSEYLYSFKEYKTMQCTGLKDKNGKLIYEGDIVKDKINQTYEIIWKDNIVSFLMKHIDGGRREGLYSLIILENGIEVIGNIYENTELLEVHHD